VDCQHRLGALQDCDVPLAFMAFIGLDLRTEMSLFVVINSKARGLTSSLTDYHESNLLDDLARDAPHLYISRKLNEDPHSPWYRLIRYGGETTSGLKRRTSFRMMQKAVSRFLTQARDADAGDLESRYQLVADYWCAVAQVFSQEWRDHRHHLLAKGVGLYSLMRLLSDMVSSNHEKPMDTTCFVKRLLPLKEKIDWRSNGMFADAGGHKGATEVYLRLKEALRQ
jgi:DGQHR domain-containing protein